MAEAGKIVNQFGVMTGWNSVTVNLLGRDLEGITELAYSDKEEKKNARGFGKYSVGRTTQNYEANASINIYVEEVAGLDTSLPVGKRIQDIEPFDITVVYDLNGVIRKDIIRSAQFTNRGVEVKNGDGTISTKHELIVAKIDWNVI